MTARTLFIAAIALVAAYRAGGNEAAQAASYIEPPWFNPKIATGVLPPIALRLPEAPSVVSFADTPNEPAVTAAR